MGVLWKRLIGSAAALAAIGALLSLVYLGLTRDLRREDADSEIAYQRIEISRGDLQETILATGRTEPFGRLVVQSEIPGIVTRVHVADGDRVAAGDPLVELDRERIEHRVAELKAALEIKKAMVLYDLAGRARVELEESEQNYERVAELYSRGIISEREMQNAATKRELARISVTDAKAERAARKAAVVQATEALREAERYLKRSVIRAPFDGVVLRRQVDVGAAVADIENGGTVIAVLANDRMIHLQADVDEYDIARVSLNQEAQVRLDAFPGESFRGVVRKVSASSSSGGSVSRFQIEVALLEPDPRIRVGMSADAKIVVGVHEDVLLVPNSALVHSTSGGVRIRVAGGDGTSPVRLVPVRTIYSDGFVTGVVGGISEDSVVLAQAEPQRQ